MVGAIFLTNSQGCPLNYGPILCNQQWPDSFHTTIIVGNFFKCFVCWVLFFSFFICFFFIYLQLFTCYRLYVIVFHTNYKLMLAQSFSHVIFWTTILYFFALAFRRLCLNWPSLLLPMLKKSYRVFKYLIPTLKCYFCTLPS